MEIQFSKNTLEYLRQVVWQSKQTEQTQDVKLPEAMPDIGSVLASWGQPVLRGKTWHGNAMTANGGIMVWILYAPEDGGPPQTVETWLPYQLRWEFPPTQHDGIMQVRTDLQALDVRSVSPRKLMVRAVIQAHGEAVEPARQELLKPEQLPDGVEALYQSYPVELPREAGETAFELEEPIRLPSHCREAGGVVYYRLLPQITDRKIMVDKAVFRGLLKLWGLCREEDGRLKPFLQEIPFSRYADLQASYPEGAQLRILPELTNAELEWDEEGNSVLKAGLVAQFVITDRTVLETVEDVYALSREMEPQWEAMELPVILEQRRDALRVQQKVEAEAAEILDVAVCLGQASQAKEPDRVTFRQPGSFQVLYTDMDGKIRGATGGWEEELSWPAPKSTILFPGVTCLGIPTADCQPGQISVQADLQLDTQTVTNQNFPMLTGLKLGEIHEKDPNRPSLILRRVGTDSLWQIAKQCGSTVEAIRKANGGEQELLPDTGLLIPIA